MSDSQHRSTFLWWAIVAAGAAAALLFTWLARLAGVAMMDLLSIGAGLAALAWMLLLVTVPWNLCFEARQVVADMGGSRALVVQTPGHRPAERPVDLADPGPVPEPRQRPAAPGWNPVAGTRSPEPGQPGHQVQFGRCAPGDWPAQSGEILSRSRRASLMARWKVGKA